MPAGDNQGYQPTEAEKARLSQLIVGLYTRGYRQISIANALGIDARTVSKYLHRAGVATRRNQYADPPHLPRLQPIAWRDSALANEPPPDPYRLSLAARSVRDSLRNLREINGVVRLAYDVTEALDNRDAEWVRGVRSDLDALSDYLRRLIAVVDDENLRRRARTDHGERDDLRTTPHAVRTAAG